MRIGKGLLPCQESSLEMLLQARQAALHAENRHDLRRLSDCSGEVAPGSVDAHELQERYIVLGTSPRHWRDPKDRLVHASPHQACGTEQDLQQTRWRSGSR